MNCFIFISIGVFVNLYIFFWLLNHGCCVIILCWDGEPGCHGRSNPQRESVPIPDLHSLQKEKPAAPEPLAGPRLFLSIPGPGGMASVPS